MSSALRFQNGMLVYPSDIKAVNYRKQAEETLTTHTPEESAPETTKAPDGSSVTEGSTNIAETTTKVQDTCEPHPSGCYKKLAFLIGSSAAILGSGAITVALMQVN